MPTHVNTSQPTATHASTSTHAIAAIHHLTSPLAHTLQHMPPHNAAYQQNASKRQYKPTTTHTSACQRASSFWKNKADRRKSRALILCFIIT